MMQLDELNTLIENSNNPRKTFLDNLELFEDFYYDDYFLIRTHILDEKLYNIINFLLVNEKEEISDYLHSELLESLYREQGNLCFKIRNAQSKHPEDIDTLFKLLNFHDNVCEKLKTLDLQDNFGHIKKYQSDELELNIVDALIMSVYEQFFSLDPIIAQRTIEFISKNPTLFREESSKKITMYNDLIYQYLDKILPLKEFIGNDLTEDNLIRKIISHQVDNKKVIQKFFKTLSADKIIAIFNDNLSELITFLESIKCLDEVEKQAIFNRIADELLITDDELSNDNEFSYLFKLIIQQNQSNLWKNYYTEEIHRKIIYQATHEPPVDLDEDMINYILDHNEDNYDFLINLEHLTAEPNIPFSKQLKIDRMKIKAKVDKRFDQKIKLPENVSSIQIRKEDPLELKAINALYYDLSGRIIDFDIALELLNARFHNKEVFEVFNDPKYIQPIIRSIITHMLATLGVPLYGVYFYHNKESNGVYYDEKQIIGININLVKDFLNKKKPLWNRLQLFITVFHEMQHAIRFHNKKVGFWDIETYEMQKEDVLEEYDPKFYKTNYTEEKNEIDARIAGLNSLSNFLETYFPDTLNIVQDKLLMELGDEKKFQEEQMTTEEVLLFQKLETISNHAFDTLIRYNPNILEKNPIFTLEYHQNGTPKTPEEIELQKNPKNQELIDEIIKKRIQLTEKVSDKKSPVKRN